MKNIKDTYKNNEPQIHEDITKKKRVYKYTQTNV